MSEPADPRVRLGITLPSFVEEAELPVLVARAADEAGIDGVFAFDHLFRTAPGARVRPALALEVVLGAVAAETSRVALASFVARATVRPPATLAAVFDTLARVAPGRFIAGVGSGDSISEPEQRAYGLPDGGPVVRLGALDAAVEAVCGRGYPVWLGGRSAPILAAAAALGDGWNGWSLAPEVFAAEVEELHRACDAARRPADEVVPTWGGLVELRPERWGEERRPHVLAGGWERIADRLLEYVEAGAGWLVFAPIDPTDPANAQAVMEEIAPRLR